MNKLKDLIKTIISTFIKLFFKRSSNHIQKCFDCSKLLNGRKSYKYVGGIDKSLEPNYMADGTVICESCRGDRCFD